MRIVTVHYTDNYYQKANVRLWDTEKQIKLADMTVDTKDNGIQAMFQTLNEQFAPIYNLQHDGFTVL